MKPAKGFTLIELLIAVSLTIFIITVSYSFFNFIEKSGKSSAKSSELQSTIFPLFYVFLKDIESADQRYGILSVKKDAEGNESLEFYTNSCYFFKGICKVKYWIYENREKKLHYLIRSEYKLNSTSLIGVDIPLTSKVKEFNVFFSKFGNWYDGIQGGRPSLVKVVLKFEKEGGELPLIFKLRN
ncbi:type II secretion system protein J [Desulfurobacterium thermolithotrophum]|uniref:PulJ/GspJ family protein n=1 Tax=Desulfurobacterium thermolithotrophum TaxID=64160 RepID=UPI0013D523D1|nr:prepilin-type N-terminal cleavage/methylation domain-containing protein [Desulfurobacterium thermolithotrophum]